MLNGITKDARYALRLLAKSPGFALIAVITLALGIGANSTVFTWAKAVVTDPLPGTEDPGRLVTVHELMTGANNALVSVSYPDYKDFRDRNETFSGLAASRMTPLSVGGREKPERVWGEVVSANYFDVLGVKLEKGRGFLPDEETVDHPVVVINDSLWKTRFGSDPDLTNKSLVINNRSFSVIGVAPDEFQGSVGGLAMSAWVPFSVYDFLLPGDHASSRGSRSLVLVGRLRPGVQFEQSSANLSSIARKLAADYPASNQGFDVRVFPLNKEPNSGQAFLIPAFALLLVIAGLVLLIACANIANLLLARGARRQNEFAIRAAVGAVRSRLIRQLIIEALVISLAGGIAGLVLAYWTSGLLQRMIPDIGYPIRFQAGVDLGVVAFTLVVSALTVLVSGVVPAIRSSNPDLVSALKEVGRSGGSAIKSKLRSGLVAAQMALSCVALVTAGLLIRTMQQAAKADPGFNPDNVLVGTVDLLAQGYNEQTGTGFYKRFLEGMKPAPGVDSVSLASKLPLRLVGDSSNSVSIEGYIPRGKEQIDIRYDIVGPDYFKTMQMPLVEGRDFSILDDSGHPGAIVINQSFARRYFAGRDPLGQTVNTQGAKLQVIGVARDAKYYTLNGPPVPYMYLSLFQHYSPQMIVLARTYGDPATALTPVSDQIRAIDPNVPLFEVRTLSRATGISLFAQQLASKLLTVFGLLALLLAGIGAYGVIAYSVAQRRHEIGIRMALGAARRDVLGLVVLGGLIAPAIGMVAGLIAAASVTRMISGMLIGVSYYDTVTYSLTAILLMLVAFVAAYVPARRASAQDPMTALRYE